MTLTLEIPNDLSAQLEHVATARGTDARTFGIEAIRHEIERLETETDAAQKRREAAAAGFGMFAGRGLSVDELLDARHAEAQAEAKKDAPSGTLGEL